MATRGARPKPVPLRLVDGTHRTARHGKAETARDKAETAERKFGKPVMPSSLKGEAAKAWKRYIVPAYWLDGGREAAAIAFCELWAQFLESPTHFVAAKHGQLRAYMSELGLTDERNRGGQEPDGDDEFFGG